MTKNEPKTKPIKANSPNAQNQHNPIYNKRLYEKTAFSAQKNEPNSCPRYFTPKTGVMAIFIRKATEYATLVGTFVAIAIATFISFYGEFFGKEIPFMWMMPASMLGGVLTSTILSYIFPKKTKSQQIEQPE